MVAANAEQAVAFSLTPGNVGDGPEGRILLENIKVNSKRCLEIRKFDKFIGIEKPPISGLLEVRLIGGHDVKGHKKVIE